MQIDASKCLYIYIYVKDIQLQSIEVNEALKCFKFFHLKIIIYIKNNYTRYSSTNFEHISKCCFTILKFLKFCILLIINMIKLFKKDFKFIFFCLCQKLFFQMM
jgi:hypothetical protein